MSDFTALLDKVVIMLFNFSASSTPDIFADGLSATSIPEGTDGFASDMSWNTVFRKGGIALLHARTNGVTKSAEVQVGHVRNYRESTKVGVNQLMDFIDDQDAQGHPTMEIGRDFSDPI